MADKPITAAQRKKLFASLKDRGWDKPTERAWVVSQRTNNRTDSVAELTSDEAGSIIDYVDDIRNEMAFPEPNILDDIDNTEVDRLPVPAQSMAVAERPTVLDYTPEQKQLIKDTVATGTTDDEFKLFLYVAKKMELDPLLKQVYAIKRWNKELGRKAMTIQTGIDGYRLAADRSGLYCAGKEPTFKYNDDGTIFSATSYLNKFVGDKWHEVSSTAIFAEYVQTNKEGHPTQFWKKMPHGQISKCAEALNIRRAFPKEIGNVYTFEEMQQADSEGVFNQLPPVPEQKAIQSAPNTPQSPDTGEPRLKDKFDKDVGDRLNAILKEKDQSKMKKFETWFDSNKNQYTPEFIAKVENAVKKFWGTLPTEPKPETMSLNDFMVALDKVNGDPAKLTKLQRIYNENIGSWNLSDDSIAGLTAQLGIA